MSRKRQRQEKRNEPIRRTRIRPRAVLALLALAMSVGVGYALLTVYQERRMSREALTVAAGLRDGGEPVLAVRHLDHHLALHRWTPRRWA